MDEFLAQKEAAGVEFFAGKEPWRWVSTNSAGKPFQGFD
jgi:hypothetical protein